MRKKKEKKEYSCFVNGMTINIQVPKAIEAIVSLLELTYDFDKVVRYQINDIKSL